MNLADAIRQASSLGDASTSSNAHVTPMYQEPAVAPKNLNFGLADPDPMPDHHSDVPTLAGTFGSTVRLELTLSPEQLSGLFRAILANQHSVMTLKEASQYLRVSATVLEALAESQEVPAFRIDGRWRFSHTALDEWLTLNRGAEEKGA